MDDEAVEATDDDDSTVLHATEVMGDAGEDESRSSASESESGESEPDTEGSESEDEEAGRPEESAMGDEIPEEAELKQRARLDNQDKLAKKKKAKDEEASKAAAKAMDGSNALQAARVFEYVDDFGAKFESFWNRLFSQYCAYDENSEFGLPPNYLRSSLLISFFSLLGFILCSAMSLVSGFNHSMTLAS